MSTATLPHRRAIPQVPAPFWAVLFAVLMVALPWEAVRGDAFADLANYAARIDQLSDFGRFYFVWENSLLGWLKFEMAWFALLVAVANMGIAPDTFFMAITGLSAFLTYRFTKPHAGALASMVLLLNPITIDLLSSQIRSAFAFALFLAIVAPAPQGWGRLRYGALAVLPFVHTALVLVCLIYVAATVLARLERIRPMWRMLASVGVALVLAVAMGTILPSIMDAAGDRRDVSVYGNKSVAYVAYWFVVGGMLALCYSRAACARWEYHFALVICFVGPIVEAMDLPGFRFVALAIPVIVVAAQHVDGPLRPALKGLTFVYGLLLFHYWIQ